ncbi:MAG: 2-C-methyl-D-erythritol 4-phosphate cytidylyltransferase [Clostridia bacterium]|nr:2-C-methyl-D-erythritol 4-phosphate cytidylyltransferase [Clostridia bacterium]
MSASVVIAAAGNSTRMGKNTNKQFLMFDRKPILAHTLLAFSALPEITEMIVVTRKDDILTVQDMIKDFSIPKVKAVLPGGTTRQESVFLGLKHVQEDRVLIHDGARPFVTGEEIRSLLLELNTCSAVALGVPVKDTVKRVSKDGLVTETLPREELWQIQTPQGFATAEILSAHQKAVMDGVLATDDCALAEYIDIPVRIVPGSYRNIKITTPEDLVLAEAFTKEQ